jgi:Rieske Fe-S protein
MDSRVDNSIDRISNVIDDLAAEHRPAGIEDLSPEELELAQTAAMLRAAASERLQPGDEFVESLARRLAGDKPAEQPAPKPARKPIVTRRSMLWQAAAAVAGLAAGGAGITAAYKHGESDGSSQEASSDLTAPMVPDDRGSWQHTGYSVASVTAGSAVRFRAGALEGFLVNPGNNRQIYALSAVCTHMGCMLSWLKDAETFLCPCHGAQYDAGGTVISGIARHPLPRLRVRAEDDGDIYVWAVDQNPQITTIAPYTKA